jgi:hypothetical protein
VVPPQADVAVDIAAVESPAADAPTAPEGPAPAATEEAPEAEASPEQAPETPEVLVAADPVDPLPSQPEPAVGPSRPQSRAAIALKRQRSEDEDAAAPASDGDWELLAEAAHADLVQRPADVPVVVLDFVIVDDEAGNEFTLTAPDVTQYCTQIRSSSLAQTQLYKNMVDNPLSAIGTRTSSMVAAPVVVASDTPTVRSCKKLNISLKTSMKAATDVRVMQLEYDI